MAFNSSLIPWKWGKREVPVKHQEPMAARFPQRDMNRLFDDFFRTFGDLPGFAAGEYAGMVSPRIDMSETDTHLVITAEIPGVREEAIDVSISRDSIMLSGDKQDEKSEKTCGYYRMERSYGAFHRTIPLPYEVDSDSAEAKFVQGVLTIRVPKLRQAQEAAKRITIKTE